MYVYSPDNEKIMAEVLKSWSDRKEIWAEGFLIWDRENEYQIHGGFARQLQVKAKKKGINLIIDRDFDPLFFDRHDRILRLFPISFVLFSKEYVFSGGNCVNILVSMEKLNRLPHPIFCYTDEELKQKEDLYSRYSRFLDHARRQITNTDDHNIVEHIAQFYFFENIHKYKPPSADRSLSTAMTRVMCMQHWFPDYNTFFELDPYTRAGFDIVSGRGSCLDDDDDIRYLGITGSNEKYNNFVARNICSPHRLSDFVFKKAEMVDYRAQAGLPSKKPQGYKSSFYRGIYFAAHMLGISISDRGGNVRDDVYTSIKDNLPKKKCFLLVENVLSYEDLKALAHVLDFLSSGSRVVFTANENFLFECDQFWKIIHGPTGLPSSLCWSRKMLDADDHSFLNKFHSKESVRDQQPPSAVEATEAISSQ